MANTTVKLMIEGGMVPQNVLRQLERWKLIPPSYASQSGTFELNWDSTEEFMTALRNAINEEASTIRETDLDRFGDKQMVDIIFSDGTVEKVEAVIDKLRRVHIPIVTFNSRQIAEIVYTGDEGLCSSRVVRVEERFEGDQHTEWVCYMEE